MVEYAGDVMPAEAWGLLRDNPDSVLIDVRTSAEWAFVGVPDLSTLAKRLHLVAWQHFPDMTHNPRFESEIEALGIAKESPLLFLCRSGQRSRSAAVAMTATGYTACYNIAHGFEGDRNEFQKRGQINGWKASRLPWIQQ